MRILFLALDIDLNVPRGDAVHTRNLARSLVRVGHQVHLIVGASARNADLDGFEVSVPPSHDDASVVLYVSGVIKVFKPDVLYERRNSPKISAAASRLCRIPYAVEFNGLVEEEALMQGRPLADGPVAQLKRRVRGRFIRDAAAVVTVAAGFRAILIERFGLDPSRVFVVENGVDANLFHPEDKASARRRLQLPEGPIVCFVGNLVQWQGLTTLVDAVAALDDAATILLVGDGPEREALVSRMKSLEVLPRFLLVGSVAHEAVPAYIASSDVCIAPFSSDRNLLAGVSALKVYEYLACGRPIVVSAIAGVREWAESYGCGVVVPPDNPKALASAISEVLSTRSFAEAALRLSELVRKERSWDRTAEKVAAILGSVVSV